MVLLISSHDYGYHIQFCSVMVSIVGLQTTSLGINDVWVSFLTPDAYVHQAVKQFLGFRRVLSCILGKVSPWSRTTPRSLIAYLSAIMRNHIRYVLYGREIFGQYIVNLGNGNYRINVLWTMQLMQLISLCKCENIDRNNVAQYLSCPRLVLLI